MPDPEAGGGTGRSEGLDVEEQGVLRVQDRQGQADVLQEGPGGNGPVVQPGRRPDLGEGVRVVPVEKGRQFGPDAVVPLRVKARQ